MNLIEPQRGLNILMTLNQFMFSSGTLTYLTPILADIFVFTYPIYLLILYCCWRIYKKIEYKIAAMWIFANVVFSILVNIGIQFFVEKSRPNIVLWLVDQKTESILHSYLPSSSFPSDHANVSMSIAIASLLRGIQKKDKKYIIFGIILIIFSLITCISRIATAIHRPTDVVWGILVGTIIPLILANKKIMTWGSKILWWIWRKI